VPGTERSLGVKLDKTQSEDNWTQSEQYKFHIKSSPLMTQGGHRTNGAARLHSLGIPWRGHCDAACAATLDELLHGARGLGLLDEFVDVS